MQASQPPELDGVTHRYVDIPSARLHVAEAGEGAPVVLLHGWPQHWWIWRKVIPDLARDHRLICPDLRGFGWSEAPPGRYEMSEFAADVVALLDELELGQVDLIGHDWGGYTGFLLCLDSPERIRNYLALGVVHPWFEPPAVSPRSLQRAAYQFILASPGLGSGVMRHAPGFVKLVLRRASHPEMRWSEAELDCYAESFRTRDHALASSHLYRSFVLRELTRLKKGHYHSRRSSVPMHLLHGDADPVIRAEILAGYEPYADRMKIEEVERCGHFVAEEKPELVVERARALFGSAQPG